MPRDDLVILNYVPPTTGHRKTGGFHLGSIKSHVAKVTNRNRILNRPASSRKGSPQHEHTLAPASPPVNFDAIRLHKELSPEHMDSLNCTTLIALLRNPLCTVGHGSSDPFNSQRIPITSETNRAISFVRDTVIPTIYMPPYAQRFCRRTIDLSNMRGELIMGSRFANRDITMHIADPDLLPAWLCSHMLYSLPHLPPGFRKEMSRLSLQIRTTKMKQLRAKISEHFQSTTTGDYLLDPTMIYQILCLFRDSCLEHDIHAALAHSTALKRALPLLSTSAATQLAVQIMCNDADYAVAPLRRTVVNIDDWMPGGFQALADTYEQHLPQVAPDVYQGIHSCIKDPTTLRALIRLRRCLAMADAGIIIDSLQQIERADTIYSWVAMVTTYDMGQLCNLILELTEKSPSTPPSQISPSARWDAFSRSICVSLTLAVLYSIRIHIHRAPLNGIDIRDAAHHLIPLLQQQLQRSLQLVSTEVLAAHNEPYLWMYFIGAHHEERIRLKLAQTSDPPLTGWFSVAFEGQVRAMGITTWENLRQVLDMFVYSDFLEPGPESGWLERVLGAEDIDTPTLSKLAQHKRLSVSTPSSTTTSRSATSEVYTPSSG